MQKYSVAVVAVLALSLAHVGPARAARPWTGYVVDSHEASTPSARRVGSGTIIYFNRDGGRYSSGPYDSRKNTNGIGSGTIEPFECGDAVWREVMSCLKASFLPYDVRVTDIDPGNVDHVETVVAGTPEDLGLKSTVGGVAPIGCDQYIDNPVAFAFSKKYACNADQICWTAAQETAHTFGLDHTVECTDHMTYDADCSDVKRFRDVTKACGEDEDLPPDQDPSKAGGPRRCVCTNASEQNSHQTLLELFGPHQNLAPEVQFHRLRDGAAVTSGFAIVLVVDDDLGLARVELFVDGEMLESKLEPPFEFSAPASLADGAHQVTARAIDQSGLVGEASVTVTQQPPCASNLECPSEYVCKAGQCIDGPTIHGGIGSICSNSAECQSKRCASGPGASRCSAPCELGASTCPDGFDCLAAGDTGACWPGDELIRTSDGGGCGCSVAGASSRASFVGFLLGFALVGAALGRRRARRG